MVEESLVKMKQLLEMDIGDNSKNEVLLHYYNRAKQIILQYCNVSQLPEQYQNTYIDFAIYLYKHKNAEGLLRRTEGERTLIYEEGIPSYIKASLPLPRIQIGGYHA